VGGLCSQAPCRLPEIARAEGEKVDRFPVRDAVLITSYLSADPVATLTRLRCSNAEIERGRRIGELRGRPPDPDNDEGMRRWMAQAGPAVDDLMMLHVVDDPLAGERLVAAVDRVRSSGAPLRLAQLAVSGDDLKEIGVPPGPPIGVVLRQLLELVLRDPSRNNREDLLRTARTMALKDGEAGA
jgi:hypothetical protein